jgi:small subunit ribosomal protein S6
MPLYEHVFLARQDLAQGQVDTLAETATRIITEAQGKVVKTETWGLRGLAYRIKKNRKGHYDVIRYMTVRVDAHEAGPSAMMRRNERSERDRGDRGGRGRDRDDRPREDRPRRDRDDRDAA